MISSPITVQEIIDSIRNLKNSKSVNGYYMMNIIKFLFLLFQELAPILSGIQLWTA